MGLIGVDVVLEQSEVEERLQRLEGHKESLQMQISILMDQIEVQTEKIADLEKNVAEKKTLLQRAEESLQKVRPLVWNATGTHLPPFTNKKSSKTR